MEVLSPEDVVDEWSDLSTSSLGSGARLGRYELILPIAYGGMARVWAARLHGQRGFSKTVAIKTILPHLAHSSEFERMFLDEARIAAGVHHPNVIEILELGEEGHVLYLAMEWVNGDSLMHVLRGEGKIPQAIEPRVAARIVADACSGLHAAHEMTDEEGRLLNVVHRDVSPHNILVSVEGTVKVTDFGVAKALGQTHQATVAGQVKGKIAYMAPEQIGGLPFDRRSDIFGMGCVLYEAATGLQPFRGGNDPLVMQAVLSGTYQPPSAIIPGFPIELTRIIDRALAPEPRARFANAEVMRVALEEWLAKSGGVLTATQTGAIVRQRLGQALDRRKELVKAALAQLPSPPSPDGRGNTPPPHSGPSHSGVVATGQPEVPRALRSDPMRAPSASTPQLPPPIPSRRLAATPLPIVTPTPSSMKYVIAALGGVLFAVVVGAISVALWVGTHPSASPAAAPVAPVQAAAKALPPPVPSSSSAPESPRGGGASAPVSAGPVAPANVDVDSLPVAKRLPPVGFQSGPAAGAVAAPRPSAAPSAAQALPANPY